MLKMENGDNKIMFLFAENISEKTAAAEASLERELVDVQTKLDILNPSLEEMKRPINHIFNVGYFKEKEILSLEQLTKINVPKPVVSAWNEMEQEMSNIKIDTENDDNKIAQYAYKFYCKKIAELSILKDMLCKRWTLVDHSGKNTIPSSFQYLKDIINSLTAQTSNAMLRAQDLSINCETADRSSSHSGSVTQNDLTAMLSDKIESLKVKKEFHEYLKVLEWLHVSFKEHPSHFNGSLLANVSNIDKLCQDVIQVKCHFDNHCVPHLVYKMKSFNSQLNALCHHYNMDVGSYGSGRICSELEQLRIVTLLFEKSFSHYLLPGQDKIKTRKYGDFTNFSNHRRKKPNAHYAKVLTELKEQLDNNTLINHLMQMTNIADCKIVIHLVKMLSKQLQDSVKKGYHSNVDLSSVLDQLFKNHLSLLVADTDDRGDQTTDSYSISDINDGRPMDISSVSIENHPFGVSISPNYNPSLESFLILRILRIKELKSECFQKLNYFKSIERTLLKDASISNPNLYNKNSTHGHDGIDVIHDSNVDKMIKIAERLQEHMFIFEDESTLGNKHAKDKERYLEDSQEDFENLCVDIGLISSHFTRKNYKDSLKSHTMPVDYCQVLTDLWTCEMEFIKGKEQLIDTYLVCYNNSLDLNDRSKLREIILQMLSERPRLDLDAPYFMSSYMEECVCLKLHSKLLKMIVDSQIDSTRLMLQNQAQSLFGLNVLCSKEFDSLKFKWFPLGSSDTNEQMLFDVYPCLGQVWKINKQINRFMNAINADIHLLDVTKRRSQEIEGLQFAIDECSNIHWIEESFNDVTKKAVFHPAYIRDPHEAVKSVSKSAATNVNSSRSSSSSAGSLTRLETSRKHMIKVFSHAFQYIELWENLHSATTESAIISKMYRHFCHYLGAGEYHAYMRCIPFHMASTVASIDDHPLHVLPLQQNDNRLDRFIPDQEILAIEEIDEAIIKEFISEKASLFSMLTTKEKICNFKIILLTEITHRNICNISTLLIQSAKELTNKTRPKTVDKKSQTWKDLNAAFTSIQIEKVYHRNKMLYNFSKQLKKMELNSANESTLNRSESLKRKLIEGFCFTMLDNFKNKVLRYQIINLNLKLLSLLNEFPILRPHFLDCSAEEPSNQIDKQNSNHENREEKSSSAESMFSSDNGQLLNPLCILSFNEIMTMFSSMKQEVMFNSLNQCMSIMGSVYHMCCHLCSYAEWDLCLDPTIKVSSLLSVNFGGPEGTDSSLQYLKRDLISLCDNGNPSKVIEYLYIKCNIFDLSFHLMTHHLLNETFLSNDKLNAWNILKDRLDVKQPTDYSAAFSQIKMEYGISSMSYYSEYFHLMRLCLAGLNAQERKIVNGELIHVCCLVEDCLMTSSHVPSDECSWKLDLPKGNLLQDLKSISEFLKLSICCERLKNEWNKHHFAANGIESKKSIGLSRDLYNNEIIPLLNKGISKESVSNNQDELSTNKSHGSSLYTSVSSTSQNIDDHPKIAEKLEEVLVLMDQLHCLMLKDAVIYANQRHRNLLSLIPHQNNQSDSSQTQHMLPTERWIKRQDALEHPKLSLPNITEPFSQSILSLSSINTNLSEKTQLLINEVDWKQSLFELNTAIMEREKYLFQSYVNFYQGSIDHLTKQLSQRDQDINLLHQKFKRTVKDKESYATCLAGDAMCDILIEFESVKSKLFYQEDENKLMMKEYGNKLKQNHDSVVLNLLKSSLCMRKQLESSRVVLYNDVTQNLSICRAEAINKMKALTTAKSSDSDDNSANKRKSSNKWMKLSKDVHTLNALLLKQKCFFNWQLARHRSEFTSQMANSDVESCKIKLSALMTETKQKKQIEALQEQITVLQKMVCDLKKELDTTQRRNPSDKRSESRLDTSAQKTRSEKLQEDRDNSMNLMLSKLHQKETDLISKQEKADHVCQQHVAELQEYRAVTKQLRLRLANETRLKTEAFNKAEEWHQKVIDLENQLYSQTGKSNGDPQHSHCLPVLPAERMLSSQSLTRVRQFNGQKQTMKTNHQRPKSCIIQRNVDHPLKAMQRPKSVGSSRLQSSRHSSES